MAAPEDEGLDALIAQMVLAHTSPSDLQHRTCVKCGEDVTFWLSPCAEPGCPAVKQDS